MIDLHCHVLPGIDDGPPTMADSLDLARAHVASGTSTVVATSHVSWDHPANGVANLPGLVGELRDALVAAEIPLDVRVGAEVALTRVGEMEDEELRALTLGGGPWLLVECPFTPSPAGFDIVLGELERRGHSLLIAHPERCPAFLADIDLLVSFTRRGMLTSVTAGALVGQFGRDPQRFAHELLRRGICHSVASDAHDLDRRPPGIRPVLERAGLADELITWLGEDVPAAILRGEDLPPQPAYERPGLLRRLRRAS